MSLELYSAQVLIGSIVRSQTDPVFAYCPAGRAIGELSDIDAAAAALARLVVA